MSLIFTATEAKAFCLIAITFLLVFKARISINLTKKQAFSYALSILGILLSVLGGFFYSVIFSVSTALCFTGALFLLILGKKKVICAAVSVLFGALSFYCLISGLNLATYILVLAAVIQVIVEQYNQMRIDKLTKVYNRYGLDVELKEQLRQYRRDKTDSFYVISCDMDKFKQINDSWGHDEGDRALKLVSLALFKVATKFDSSVFRIGGDEFIIITDTSETGLAEKVIEAVKAELDSIDFRDDFKLKMSLGYALYDGKSSIDELLKAADKELYDAKKH